MKVQIDLTDDQVSELRKIVVGSEGFNLAVNKVLAEEMQDLFICVASGLYRNRPKNPLTISALAQNGVEEFERKEVTLDDAIGDLDNYAPMHLAGMSRELLRINEKIKEHLVARNDWDDYLEDEWNY